MAHFIYIHDTLHTYKMKCRMLHLNHAGSEFGEKSFQGEIIRWEGVWLGITTPPAPFRIRRTDLQVLSQLFAHDLRLGRSGCRQLSLNDEAAKRS